MRFLKSFAIVVLPVIFWGCAGIDRNLKVRVSEGANPWTHLNLYNNPDNFQFAIVADRTGGHRPGVFADAVRKLNLLKPEFVVSVGDLIEGGTEDEDELNRQWDEFDNLVDKLQMPFFYVPGNHDISNKVMAQKWQERLGSGYYYFTYRGVLFLCLNTEDPPSGGISDEQVEHFRKVLKTSRNVRWILVFMHKPLWQSETSKDWQKFESLLADRPYTVFAGHEHRYISLVQDGRRYYALATTGASGGGRAEVGNDGRLAKCQFDHIVWVTMTDGGPAVANLLLDGVLDDEPCR